MDSSSLLQLQSQCFNPSKEDLKLSVSKALEYTCSIPEYDHLNPASEACKDKHLMDLLCDPEQPTADELHLSIPMPNFLIDPQDGQFTPYLERSPTSTPDQEYDEPMFFNRTDHSRNSSPDSVLSPLRSRATSIALKKLMETQAQMLLDISAAWKKKYPVDDFCDSSRTTDVDDKSCSESAHAQPLPSPQNFSLLPANPIFPSSQAPRKVRSMSHKSSASLASMVDQLSLRDRSKTSLVADVESWKRDALQSKLKQEATKNWIDCLPTSGEFEDLGDSL
ncbi:hypothetical protein PCASD_24218 [Puccinia coronata f. sp. avenae]|uniref:Uncharacterized protein n=1 Tax=Puccinia coronata f. sp. avenae TaxID=200324 RepID=A0A2N5S5S7_9BASI|nr:hypothetical protein PCASD_24218 [Puccinia coronata f. sp. avenae]